MMNSICKIPSFVCFSRQVILISVLLLRAAELFSQEPPPREIQVTVVRGIDFGGFVQSPGGGTVTISYDGNRNGTNVFFVSGYTYTSGQFNISGTIGTSVTILVDVNPITLTNGGTGTMSLNIDQWSFTPPDFILPTDYPATSSINFGGTLSVGAPAVSPPGNYTGTLFFTFIQNNE
jgi:hypothetical protein